MHEEPSCSNPLKPVTDPIVIILMMIEYMNVIDIKRITQMPVQDFVLGLLTLQSTTE